MTGPRTVDPGSLGPRCIAGYFACFGVEREHNERGTRYTETLTPGVFDDDLAEYGRNHAWSVLWDHGLGGVAGDDPDRLATVPVGRALTVEPDAYGPFTIVELRAGRLADEIIAAARAGTVGFSYHGVDLDPDHTEDRNGQLYVTRRRMSIKEITLTSRPAEPGAVVVAVGSPAVDPGLDLRNLDDKELISRATAWISATGGSGPLLEMRAAQGRAASRRHTQEQAARVRQLAACIVQGHRRAAALRSAAAEEARRWPQDPHRPAAAILAEAIVEKAAARQAESELREACVNDAGLIGAVMREAMS